MYKHRGFEMCIEITMRSIDAIRNFDGIESCFSFILAVSTIVLGFKITKEQLC